MGEKLIITLDGPAGSGKSSAAQSLARHFNIPYLDSGAMYRTVAFVCLRNRVSLDEESSVVREAEKLEFRFGFDDRGASVEVSENGGGFQRRGEEIRTPEASLAASKVAKIKDLRKVLVEKQRRIGNEKGGVIEGRDAGTVIFPKARYKFFLTASPEERARRRHLELMQKLGGSCPSFEEILRDQQSRDETDQKRAESPLKPAEDAVILDTTGLELAQVVHQIAEQVQSGLSRE